jgi:hypothetical protein
MAWAGVGSDIFRAFVADVLTDTNLTTFGGLDADTIKVALYNDSITPDQNAAVASTAYNTGQWAVANELSDGAEWPAGGATLGGQTVNAGTAGVVFFDGNDLASGTSATIAGTFGCLVYDDTVTATADRGICFNYFGGSQSVTNGTLTLVWNASGIFRFTL